MVYTIIVITIRRVVRVVFAKQARESVVGQNENRPDRDKSTAAAALGGRLPTLLPAHGQRRYLCNIDCDDTRRVADERPRYVSIILSIFQIIIRKIKKIISQT